ncbi:hypothetical protein ANMWB30_28560 [Arthrobacter sp. MWB30]|nr:hypothetical protein ANMWB30_28560 [Arthrobacter sp. MWB30]
MLEWKCTAGKAAGSSLILDFGVSPYLSSTVPTLVVSSLSGLHQVPQNSLFPEFQAGCPGNRIQ